MYLVQGLSSQEEVWLMNLTLQYTDKVSLGYSTQLGLMADLVS